MSNSYLKPLITGAVAVAGDKMLFNEPDLTKSLYFGAAVAGGTYIGAMVGDMIPVVVPSTGFFDGKTLEVRLAEVGVGAGSAYALNRYVLKNDYQYSQMLNKIALIAGADFVAEYITDYLENRPLSFFA
jgi:hypothetical protein